MRNTLSIPTDFYAEVLRRDPDSISWLEQIPALFARLCALWNLTQDGDPMFGRTAIVVPVMRGSIPAALKLVSPFVDVQAEARALKVLKGAATVQLLDASLSHRALLLDRLEQESLKEAHTPREAVAIAGRIAASISAVPAHNDAPQMSATALDWLAGIRTQHARAIESGHQVSEDQFGIVEDIIGHLARHDSATMTHGDLSIDNILRSSPGHWVAIDPYFQAGPVTNEAHTVVRSYLPEIFTSDTPSRMLENLTREFCTAAQVRYLDAQRLSFARYVASYYWEAQNGGDPLNIDRLRRAIDPTYRILQQQ